MPDPTITLTITRHDGATITRTIPLLVLPNMVSIGSAWVSGARISDTAFGASFGAFLRETDPSHTVVETTEYAINDGSALYGPTRNVGSDYDDDGRRLPLFVSYVTRDLPEALAKCDAESAEDCGRWNLSRV